MQSRAAKLFLSLFLLLPLAGLRAQLVTSEISGTVTDSAGAAVPNAKVSITQVETGAVRNTVSDAHGQYHVTGLVPGGYTLEVQANGFKTLDRQGITLAVDQHPVVDGRDERMRFGRDDAVGAGDFARGPSDCFPEASDPHHFAVPA